MTIQIDPLPGTDNVHILRNGQVFAVPTGEAAELPGTWFPVEGVPATHTTAFTKREAALLHPLLGARQGRGGPKLAKAATPDARLIDQARKALGLRSNAELEARTGINRTLLSKARSPVDETRSPAAGGGRPLTEENRATLRALIAGSAKAR